MFDKLTKIYKDAPPAGKIMLIAVVIIIAYLIYRGIKKLMEGTPPNTNLVDNSKNELNQLAQSGEVTHYTKTQLSGFADKLFTAMDGQGTDEDQIKEVFGYMQNKADVLELIKAFGIRDYEDELFVVQQYNLSQWLNTELSASELNEYVNDPLKAKGIDYTF